MRAVVLVAGALLAASAARADEADYPVIPEHEFVVVESGTVRVKTDDDKPPSAGLRESTWAQQHLQRGHYFLDPFVGPELYPEVSATTAFGLDSVGKGGKEEFRSTLKLSLYLLDITLPLVSSYEGARTQGRFDLALKVPFAIPGAERHRFALELGAIVPPAGPTLTTAPRAQLLYGWGGPLSFQIKFGWGYQQLFPEQPARLGALYGATLGANLGWIAPIVQIEGLHTALSKANAFAFLPGLRFFPFGTDSLQLGLAGLVAFGNRKDIPARRGGVFFDLGYNFL